MKVHQTHTIQLSNMHADRFTRLYNSDPIRFGFFREIVSYEEKFDATFQNGFLQEQVNWFFTDLLISDRNQKIETNIRTLNSDAEGMNQEKAVLDFETEMKKVVTYEDSIKLADRWFQLSTWGRSDEKMDWSLTLNLYLTGLLRSWSLWTSSFSRSLIYMIPFPTSK